MRSNLTGGYDAAVIHLTDATGGDTTGIPTVVGTAARDASRCSEPGVPNDRSRADLRPVGRPQGGRLISTYYYPLTPPITSVRVANGGHAHDVVLVWINGAKAGGLTVRPDETAGMLRALSENIDVAQKFAVGKGQTALKVFDSTVGPDDVLISDYGEVTSLRDLVGEVDRVPVGTGMPAVRQIMREDDVG